MLAIDGRFEFANKTNPFGGGKSTPKPADNAVITKRRAALDVINVKAMEALKRKKHVRSH